MIKPKKGNLVRLKSNPLSPQKIGDLGIVLKTSVITDHCIVYFFRTKIKFSEQWEDLENISD